MARIPIFTSRAPMQGPIVVEPHPMAGTEVAEAIGGFARTVGGVASDWANKKAETEMQTEYVSNTSKDAEFQAEFLKARKDDPNYLDDKLLKTNYESDMQKNRKGLEWKYDFTKKKFAQTSQLSDLSTLQKAYDINRRTFIDAKKTQGDITTQRGLKLRSKAILGENIKSLRNVYSAEELKEKEIRDYKALSMLKAGDLLKQDINADLSGKEFDNIKDEKKELRNKIKKTINAERKRVKQIASDDLKEEREVTEQSFTKKLVAKELGTDEILSSKLTGQRQQHYLDLVGVDLSGAIENDFETYAETSRIAEHKIGDRVKFVDAVTKAIKDKKLKNKKGTDFIDQWDKKEKDVGYEEAEKVIYGEDVILDFSQQAELWVDFNEIRNAEPDKYKGRASYDLAVTMKEEREALMTEEDKAKAAYSKRWSKLKPTTYAQIKDVESTKSDLVRGRYSIATMMGEVIEGEIDSLSKAYDYISKRRLVPDFFKSELQSYAKKEGGILMENKEGIVGIVPLEITNQALKDGYRKW